MIAKKEIVRRLEANEIQLPPLRLAWSMGWLERDANTDADAVIWASWGKQKAKFLVECRAQSTPRLLRDAISLVKQSALRKQMSPMLIVPYLREESLRELEREGVSGVDLCGNGIVIVPEKFSIYRAGNPNQFTNSDPIKNIYRRNSSMVARLLLARPQFNSVTEMLAEVNRRNPMGAWSREQMALPTVSKVLKTLADEMIVAREGYATRLLQADRLLEELQKNYRPPRIKEKVNWQIPMPPGGIVPMNEVLGQAFKSEIPAVLTGASPGTISRYAVMQAGETNAIYCPDPEKWLANVPGRRNDRFPTITILQTDEASVYFDANREADIVSSSPVQTYLELMAGDKRDQETAIQVKEYILQRLKGARQ